MPLPYWLLKLLPMWSYICPKCKCEVKKDSHKCLHCGELYGSPVRVPPKFLQDKDALERYVHEKIFPKISASQRAYLSRFFTEFFNNGFEEGNFSAWTSTTGSPTIVTDPVHHGTYAMRVIGNNAGSADYASKNISFGSANPRFLRTYLYFDDLGDEDYTGNILGIYYYDSCLGGFIVRFDGSKNVIRVVYSDTLGANGTTDLQEDTWYCFEIEQKNGSGDGYVKIYLDDNLEAENTGLTITSTPASIRVGINSDYKGPTIIFDCVVVADAYIGPEGEAPPEAIKGIKVQVM
jgi:hypothetical protein